MSASPDPLDGERTRRRLTASAKGLTFHASGRRGLTLASVAGTRYPASHMASLDSEKQLST